MELLFGDIFNEPSSAGNSLTHPNILKCPFLRNLNEPTSFSLASSLKSSGFAKCDKGPIFEDGPDFQMAFRLFHGQDGVVPLSNRPSLHDDNPEFEPVPQFNPLAAKAATISLSAFGFGPGGPFSFDFFSKKCNSKKKQSSKKENSSEARGNSSHESMSNAWLEMGQCPIAKSYRAVSRVLPLVAKALHPPPGMKLKCPPAVVAARAALARTALVKTLRPKPLPAKMLAIAMLGMAANIPLGVWREHTQKFSPQWFVAVHSAVPFIAMLRKSVVMPKTAMVITIAASILGQTIGAKAEQIRMKTGSGGNSHASCSKKTALDYGNKYCSSEAPWDPLALEVAPVGPSSSGKAGTCF